MELVALNRKLMIFCEQVIRELYPTGDLSRNKEHIWRVIKIAVEIAISENWANLNMKKPSITTVVLVALFHDLKYQKHETSKPKSFLPEHFNNSYLESWNELKSELDINEEEVFEIVKTCSWSYRKSNPEKLIHKPEAYCVYDADMLDSIGAIGILRLSAFGTTENKDAKEILKICQENLLLINKNDLFSNYAKTIGFRRNKMLEIWADELENEIRLDWLERFTKLTAE